MSPFATRSQLSDAARITLTAGLLLFVLTIVVGILNGTDLWNPDHDTLIGHVHAGTLGWITLGVAGIVFLVFSAGRDVGPAEVRKVRTLALALIGAVVLYVGAFFLGDGLFDDRIQRPIVGTLLFLVVIWFFVWLVGAYRAYETRSAARLGFVLAWVSLIIGSVFGVMLGLYTSNGEIPGLADKTAAAVAEAHPPAMVIGYLLLAAFAAIEWLLHDDKGWSRAASIQMWLLFVAGIVINISFVAGLEEQLAGPANLLMIAAGGMLLWRSRHLLLPRGWRNAGAGVFPRLSLIFLVAYLALLTVLVSWIISGTVDFDALTESQEGLLLSFDHTMFIGVMTNVVFGVLAAHLAFDGRTFANRFLICGVNVGILGFAIGLITTTTALKRAFTPLMGAALLVGIGAYLMQLRSSTRS
ncbi:MAG: hypothetical protein ABIJ75_04250 [Actinomycetota bacterium]